VPSHNGFRLDENLPPPGPEPLQYHPESLSVTAR
jgi:hypothetical protein